MEESRDDGFGSDLEYYLTKFKRHPKGGVFLVSGLK